MKNMFFLPVFLSMHIQCFTLAGKKEDQPEIPVKGYKLIWKDEFNGNTLDRTKWKYRGLVKRGDAFNSTSAVKLDGKGCLIIEAKTKGDSILAGIIDTEKIFETKYGYFECRASLPKTPGIWVGFWLQSSANQDNSTPEKNGLEIDIFEYAPHNRKDAVAHALHWGGYGPTHKIEGPVYSSLSKTTDGFHTFGLEWTEDTYTVFVDGVKMHSSNALISKVSEFIVLSLEANKQVAGPLNPKDLPDGFIVDYVRVYKKNK